MPPSGPWRKNKGTVWGCQDMPGVSGPPCFQHWAAGQLPGGTEVPPLREQLTPSPICVALSCPESESLRDLMGRCVSFSWLYQRKIQPARWTPPPHTWRGPCGCQLVDLSCLHLLEGKERYWLLINPPNPAVSNISTLVKFWVKVNDSIVLLSMFFRKVTRTQQWKRVRP